MSAYEGYLKFGSHEVVNNSRVRGIAESAQPCPMYWLRGPYCDTMWDALGEVEPYAYNGISEAPWYDPDIPHSRDFYGFFANSIIGTYDSTRTVSQVEGLTDGGTLGRTRKAMKTARVTGILMGRGRPAIEYGQAWLSAALDPDGCGQVGFECGVEDVEFFADCPPARGTVPELTPWATTRTNGVPNPRFVGTANAASTNAGLWSLPTAGGTWGASDGAVNIADTAAVQTIIGYEQNAIAAAPGEVWTASRLVTVPAGAPAVTMRLAVVTYVTGGPSAEVAYGPTITIEPGTTQRLAVTSLPLSANAIGVRSIMYLQEAAVAAGTNRRVVYGEALVEHADTVLPYFDGDTPDQTDPDGTALAQFSWTGVANASASIEQTREWYDRPFTDQEYAAVVDPYRRYLKNAAVVSGPLIGETLNAGDFWAYEVEFTLVSERPWVYGKTKSIPLTPVSPVIVEDITYNRAPYPSAERAEGTVVVQTNYSTNPSAETDVTGWALTYDGTVITTGGVLARGTAAGGDLVSVGAASAKLTWTAPATFASPGGWIGLQQDVTVPITAATRVSINMWSALLLTSGTAVLGGLELTAYWRAAGATVRTDPLGTFPASGGPMSFPNLDPPDTATSVIVRVKGLVTSATAGAVLKLFADALAVTIP